MFSIVLILGKGLSINVMVRKMLFQISSRVEAPSRILLNDHCEAGNEGEGID